MCCAIANTGNVWWTDDKNSQSLPLGIIAGFARDDVSHFHHGPPLPKYGHRRCTDLDSLRSDLPKKCGPPLSHSVLLPSEPLDSRLLPRKLFNPPTASVDIMKTRMLSLALLSLALTQGSSGEQPNIIFILADDLGYGDLGCYGQELIKTPNLDRMAAEGLRFRNFYAGCTVCASSRSVLMTGQHMGHTYVRGNGAGAEQALRPDDITVAEVLREAGYATALCGKWGLGDDRPGDTGLPNDQGFDHFFGYLNQVHAHNYYPEFLWLNKSRMPLRNKVERAQRRYGGFSGGYAVEKIDYSHDLILSDALRFIERNQDKPFFLYLALTIPHANNEGTRMSPEGNGQEVPHYGRYAQEDWPDQDKGQAAMITRMDHGIGVLLKKLKALDIDDKTLVMFSSDNGHHDEGGHDTERFDPNGPLRGMKRDLYEGGIRVPMIARWPGKTEPGSITDHISYFGDLMATAADLAGVAGPRNIDSISFVPTLTGRSEEQRRHDYLYWEFYEQGSKQAVRFGKWKAVRQPMFEGDIELYDLDVDLGEGNNLAASHGDLVAKAREMMEQAHRPNPNWKARGEGRRKQPIPGDGKLRF